MDSIPKTISVMLKLLFIMFLFSKSTIVLGQFISKNGSDLIDSTLILNYQAYKIKSGNDFKIGTKINRKVGETKEQFLTRIFPTTEFVHGPFEIGNWKNKFGKHIITFQKAPFIRQFRNTKTSESDFITGILLVPLDSNRNYLIVKICEISSEGGEVGIESLFFTNTDQDKRTVELGVITTERFERHGIDYNTHLYQNEVVNCKLKMIGSIFEKCNYKEVFKDGGWDFWMGESGLPTRIIKCNLNTAENIKLQLENNGY